MDEKTTLGVTPDLGLPPEEERIATFTIVWAKDGRMLVNYPLSVPIATKMLSSAMGVVSDHAAAQEDAAKVQQPSKIIMPPMVDPRFLKRDGG